MRALVRQPLLHFLAIGGLLFVLAGQRAPDESVFDDTPIVVTADDVARLRSAWLRDSGREPDEAELRANITRHVDEALMLREALRIDLDTRDPVARERLLLNLRFLFPERRTSDETLLREARMLGMVHTDPVVRRRLLQAMERRLSSGVVYDEAALRDYVERNAGRYGRQTRYAFSHVYYSSDNRHAAARAAQAFERLRVDARASVEDSDVFLLGDRFPPSTREEIARRFGEGFMQALVEAPLDAWTAPVASPYGLHLLRVERRVDAEPPAFDAVRARALQAWRVEREAGNLRAALAALRARYPVEERAS